MRLLVSVRSAKEARAAWQGGADIIDAKEPGAGALAPVTPDVLEAIVDAVPPQAALSVALGDVYSKAEARDVVGCCDTGSRSGQTYVKFALPVGARAVEECVRAAVVESIATMARPRVVVAVYVDRLSDMELDLRAMVQAVGSAGAYGILLDTARKDGKNLFHWCDTLLLAELVERAHSLALRVALAGSVGEADLPAVFETGADIVGVRGAVCEGGRSGTLREELVRRLASQVRPSRSLNTARPSAPASHI